MLSVVLLPHVIPSIEWQSVWCARWGGEAAGRQHAMPHIKTYVRYHTGAQGGATELAWLLLSSHNLSKVGMLGDRLGLLARDKHGWGWEQGQGR